MRVAVIAEEPEAEGEQKLKEMGFDQEVYEEDWRPRKVWLADTRTDPGQSLELYRSLKTVGDAPVRLIRYPGEGHGNRKAATRFDDMLRLLGWMEHYLQGPGGDPSFHALSYGLEGMTDQ
jgi:hypothetical protein